MTNCAHHKSTFAACLLVFSLSTWAEGGEGRNIGAEFHPSAQATDVRAQLPADAVQRRKQFLDSRVIEYRFAKYLSECCVAKLESAGSATYPEEARGKLYGTVLVQLAIKADGAVEAAKIVRSSGYAVLDRAALDTVKAASPFLPFPPDVSRDTDVIEVVRPFNFQRAAQNGRQ